MATPDSFWNGMMAMIVGLVLSAVLFLGVGWPSERMVATFETTNISESGTVYDLPGDPVWADSYNNITFWMSLMYMVIISPAVLGIIIMFASAIKTQEYDVYTDIDDEGSYGYGGQAVPQNISAQEIAFRRRGGL